ncbi:hypothetical protein [uncultured Peptoniphilus sp.]|uniref:OB-fold protein n=1 Tax=uncultured Peptoniphilus sp. TaxID=254354 RepID=UPI002803C31C|nr:hypothetical protein [uncultured Peptoniphilus sp.]
MAKKITGEDGKVYVEKKPFYKRIWFIILMLIIVVSVVSKLGGGNNSAPAEGGTAPTETKSNEKITYTTADAGQMLQDLENNALNAQKTYKDQYLEITGKIYNIDSSGEYISIDGVNDDFTLTGITCYLKDDAQKDIIASTQKGQTVTIKGKVTEVGEIMGYSVDVNEIIAK